MQLGGTALQQQANKFGMNNAEPDDPAAGVAEQLPAAGTDPALTAYSAIGQFSDR